jgi:hypothetical protein
MPGYAPIICLQAFREKKAEALLTKELTQEFVARISPAGRGQAEVERLLAQLHAEDLDA